MHTYQLTVAFEGRCANYFYRAGLHHKANLLLSIAHVQRSKEVSINVIRALTESALQPPHRARKRNEQKAITAQIALDAVRTREDLRPAEVC